MKLPGVTLYPETERFYPNGNFASHLIGIAQKDPDSGELKGALGVEKYLIAIFQDKKVLYRIFMIFGVYCTKHQKKSA